MLAMSGLEVGAELAVAVGTAALAVATVILAAHTHTVATKTEGVAEKTQAVADRTGALAEQTKTLVQTTADLVEKTAGLVEASLREAKATEGLAQEAKTDRQLVWRPQLELVRFHGAPPPGNGTSWRIRNTGAGPALQVVGLARRPENIGIWAIVEIGDLIQGELKEAGASWTEGGPSLTSPYEGVPGMQTREVVVVVLLCTDVLGRRYRFAHARDVALPPENIRRRALPVEISLRTEEHPEHTDWAAEPLIWG
jgi:hypothetical protein